MNAQAPRPGRMHVEAVLLNSGDTGLDFVIPGRSVPEVFAARLMDGSDNLEILGTGSLGRGTLASRIARIEALAGGPGRIRRISGYASDTFRDLIRGGRFDTRALSASLGRKLGGTWTVETAPRPNTIPPTRDVTATRLGDLP